MPSWTIDYHPKALDDFTANVALKDRDFLFQTIETRLSTSPDKVGKPLGKALSGYRRIRISKYRVVYQLKKEGLTVYVLIVDRREDVYYEALKRLGLI